MNKLFKILSILIVIISCFHNTQAQTTNYNDSSLNGNEFNFPPLKVVIDSVLKHSAMVNFRKNHIGVKESTLESERIYWTRNLGIQADSRYGNINSFSTSEDGIINSSALTTSKQLNYSVGFYLKFPVFDFINRKHQMQLARLEVDEAKSMAEFQEEEVRQTVIKLYQDLILKQKLLQIRSKSFSDGKVNLEMIE
jgi:outer membrane protein TolC